MNRSKHGFLIFRTFLFFAVRNVSAAEEEHAAQSGMCGSGSVRNGKIRNGTNGVIFAVFPVNGASVLRKEFCDFVAVDPDLIRSVLLVGMENQLDAEMQVRRIDIVSVFAGAVAGHAEVSDDLARGHDLSFVHVVVGMILAQVCIVIVPLAVEAADPDAPAAVLVPADRLDIAGFYSDDRRSDGAHHIMSEMMPAIAVAAGGTEIVEVAVIVAAGDRRERLQPVFFLVPIPSVYIFIHRVGAEKSVQNRAVSFFVIGLVFHPVKAGGIFF